MERPQGAGRYSQQNHRHSHEKQICVIPFKRDYLLDYTHVEPTPLEIAESVDMMRVLEHGMKVRMVPTRHQTYAVDTNDDLLRVEQLMRDAV